MEKGVERAPPYENGEEFIDVKQVQIGEATGIFGDFETAERYGYVSRGSVTVWN
jgi:amino acid transporter